MSAGTVVWLRLDLRLRDQPALRAAIDRGGPVVPVFVDSDELFGPWRPGRASRWWLHRSLDRLDASLRGRGSRLVIRQGDAAAELIAVAETVGADAIYWNRLYEPSTIAHDRTVKARLSDTGFEVRSFADRLLHEPWDVLKNDGTPYQVFTPLWRAYGRVGVAATPLPAPRALRAPERWPESVALDALGLEPTVDWAKQFSERWTPGETGAAGQLRRAVRDVVADYDESRDLPDRAGTSRLSPHLHFGEVSARTIWATVCRAVDRGTLADEQATPYLRQLVWREFGHQLLYHFPHTDTEPLREEFASFAWRDDGDQLRAWQRGRTGYPIVDAGMRELWTTGWMHNRVRMVVASFLVKDLLIPWQRGAEWFWDTLVDADLANNTMGWQWTAGSGADAAPYFRIYNPVRQGERFDPDGAYVRRWVPELGSLPDKWIHQPWAAPTGVLAEAGVRLGSTYPEPIVDHAVARDVAMAKYKRMRDAIPTS